MAERNFFRITQKKAHAERRYRNPYFKQIPAKKRRWPWLIFGTVVLALSAWLFYVLFTAEIYTIKEVQILGNETIPKAELQLRVDEALTGEVWGIFPKRNRFLFDQSDLAQQLSRDFTFESLSAEVTGQVLTITIQEKNSELLWQAEGRWFLVDAAGVVIRLLNAEEEARLQAPDPEPEIIMGTLIDADGTEREVNIAPPPTLDPIKKLPRFIDVNDLPVSPHQTVLTEWEVTNIFLFYDRLKELGLKGLETRIDRVAGKWMSVRTDRGFEILFDPTADVNAQIERLSAIWREQLKERLDLQYIDLRFGDHVYFK